MTPGSGGCLQSGCGSNAWWAPAKWSAAPTPRGTCTSSGTSVTPPWRSPWALPPSQQRKQSSGGTCRKREPNKRQQMRRARLSDYWKRLNFAVCHCVTRIQIRTLTAGTNTCLTDHQFSTAHIHTWGKKRSLFALQSKYQINYYCSGIRPLKEKRYES